LEAAQHPPSQKGWGFLKAPENYIHPLIYQDKGITRQSDIKKLPAQSEEIGPIHWLGLEDRYFLWAVISRSLSPDTRADYGWREGNILYSELVYPKEIVAPNGKMEKEFSVYIGPKDIEHLKGMQVSLEKAVDYGWFSWVAIPLLWLLKFFHHWVGNWGIAIILLTIFIKLLLHPINKKTLESMKAMQKLQPKLTEIREKYQNDRERMNLEMMNLFKTHKVNPMGGCLPMILQMPVYIALYKVLYNAIELYHAPFFGFYRDLSAPDPYFISPILLGIFMVVQQKMTPSAAQDKAQANMMMIMPLMFATFMLFLPSGLVIYIFVNTLMTVVQQYMHQHEMSFADLIRRERKTAKS
jgi:YidC/Oxa1 family membrane protein insertase